jgi:hypothetical protein
LSPLLPEFAPSEALRLSVWLSPSRTSGVTTSRGTDGSVLVLVFPSLALPAPALVEGAGFLEPADPAFEPTDLWPEAPDAVEAPAAAAGPPAAGAADRVVAGVAAGGIAGVATAEGTGVDVVAAVGKEVRTSGRRPVLRGSGMPIPAKAAAPIRNAAMAKRPATAHWAARRFAW